MEELKNIFTMLAGFVAVILVIISISAIFGKLNFLGSALSVFLSWIVFLVVTNWMLKK